MMARLVGIVVLAVLAVLGGCALTSRSAPLEVRYFSPEPPPPGPRPRPQADTAPAEHRARVRLGRVVPSAHLREEIVRRTSAVELERSPIRRWTEQPDAYVRRALARALFDERPLDEAVGGRALTLHVEVVAFEEVVGARHVGRVGLHYRLHDERTVLDSGVVTVERDVAGGDFAAVVTAIGAALDEASARIADRVLREQLGAGGAVSCATLGRPGLWLAAPSGGMREHRGATFASRLLDRALQPLSKVHPGEGIVASLLLVCVFLLLASYYMMKTAREGLILTSGTFGLRGDELKTYANGTMAVLLIALVPLYGMLANRVRRMVLINISYAVVVGGLLGFFVLGHAGVPIGIAFFVWLGIVSLFLVAQFWSYANDLYTEEQGKRLFAIIAVGGSLGAMLGPRLAQIADSFTLMPLAALVLLGCVALLNVVERLDGRSQPTHVIAAPITGKGGFSLVLHDRYLILIASLVLVSNLVNTTGEYILSNAVRDHALAAVPDTAYAALAGAAREAAIETDRRELIKGFYSDFFSWVNTIAFVVQAFVVSRVIRHFGVRRALFVMPIVVLGAYTAIGVLGGLALIRAAKIAENSTDYSLQNTVRQTLFLPMSRAAKYKAKAAIDTFFVRAGDTLAAVLVGVWIHQVGLGQRMLSLVNVVLVGVWIPICVGIARRHRRLTASPLAAEAG